MRALGAFMALNIY